jgi:hypothetical protein
MSSQKRSQRRAAAILNYQFFVTNRLITGFEVSVQGGCVILSDGEKPLLEITSRGVRSLTDDPAFIDGARELNVRLAVAMYRPGASIPLRGSWADRRAFRRAGFRVINDNPSARFARFVLGS